MKTKTTTIFLLFFTFINFNFSQTHESVFTDVAFIVGNEKMGYENKTFICSKDDIIKINGVEVPALSYFINNKSDFLGGILVNEKGKKTTIKDLYFEQNSANGLISLKVVGQKFQRHITIEHANYFLFFDYNSAKFYTDKFGIWSIYKKKQ